MTTGRPGSGVAQSSKIGWNQRGFQNSDCLSKRALPCPKTRAGRLSHIDNRATLLETNLVH